MLYRTRDADREVEVWRYDFPCLANLKIVRDIAGVDGCEAEPDDATSAAALRHSRSVGFNRVQPRTHFGRRPTTNVVDRNASLLCVELPAQAMPTFNLAFGT